MKNVILCLLLLALVSCSNKRTKSPLKTSFDYCSLLINEKQSSSVSVDSLLEDGKTGIFVLEKGSDAIAARANLSQNAQKSMDIQYFIFSEDNIGTLSCDYMLRAACRGVKVRVLVDDLLLETNNNWILSIDQHENVEIKIYNPNINIGKSISKKIINVATDFRGINQRMHHKTFIVDGKVAITGGRNIADEYFDFDHEYNFRDRDVFLVGGEVDNIQTAFDQYWNSELSVPISDLIVYSSDDYDPAGVYQYLHDYANDSLNFWPEIRASIPHSISNIMASEDFVWVDSVSFVSDDPGKNSGEEGLNGGGNSTSALINMVNEAKESIYIQSPYLVVSDLGYELFRNAVQRGVEVHILTNSLASTDNLEAFNGYQRNRKRLVKAGLSLYEYRPDAKIRKDLMVGQLQKNLDFVPVFGLHAKSMVVDDSISIVGTFNLDPRSANLNTECIAIIYDYTINSKMKAIMKEELLPENAWSVSLENNPDKNAKKWKRFNAWTRRVVPSSIL